MVALAIFAAMTGMFMQVVSSNAAARHHTLAIRQALLVGQSQLALAMETRAGPQTGRAGGLIWRTEAARYPGSENGHGLEKVTVIVVDTATRREITRLSSLRLVH